jgi:hypothetical protein
LAYVARYFLATENNPPLDGILYPSVQVAGNALNIVLFHKAAWVERMDIPQGTEIRAHSGHMSDEGWEYDYSVSEEAPSGEPETEPSVRRASDYRPDWEYDKGFGMGKSTLRIDPESMRVHHVRAVQFDTTDYIVRRHRWEKHEPEF